MLQIVLTVFGAALFFAAGAGVGYWFATGGGKRKRAEEIQQEYDAYRDRVNNHFAQTAEHFRTIGREYRALYDHMASGADALCDPQAVDGRLAFAPVGPTTEDQAAASSESQGESEEAAASTAAADDDSTPDKRARDSGGESAPAEDEADAAPEQVAAEDAPAADDVAPETAEKPAARTDSDLPVDETSASGDDRERTLH